MHDKAMTETTIPLSSASDTSATEPKLDTRSKIDTTTMRTQSQSPLFQLPGEIRNLIYYYALDMGFTRSLRQPPPDPSTTGYAKLRENFEEDVLSMNLLLACKRISREAGSLFAETTMVMITPRIHQLHHPTLKRAFGSFLRVAIKCPAEHPFRSRQVTSKENNKVLLKALAMLTHGSRAMHVEHERRRTGVIYFGPCWPSRNSFSRLFNKMDAENTRSWGIILTYCFLNDGNAREVEQRDKTAWIKKKFAKVGNRFRLALLLVFNGPKEEILPSACQIFSPTHMEDAPGFNLSLAPHGCSCMLLLL